MIYVKYNPTEEFHKSIVGAVPDGVRFGIRLQINQCIAPSKVTLVVYNEEGFHEEYPMYKDVCGFRQLPCRCAVQQRLVLVLLPHGRRNLRALHRH